MQGDHHPSGRTRRRGFVIGELLVALLLLAVAVSSLAALMYSVSRRPASSAEKTECVGKNASSAKCLAQRSAEGGPSKLLRSGCATRLGLADKSCKDTIVSADKSSETIVKPRTDSASMALLPKKRERVAVRPDRGFIR